MVIRNIIWDPRTRRRFVAVDLRENVGFGGWTKNLVTATVENQFRIAITAYWRISTCNKHDEFRLLSKPKRGTFHILSYFAKFGDLLGRQLRYPRFPEVVHTIHETLAQAATINAAPHAEANPHAILYWLPCLDVGGKRNCYA